MYQLPVEIKSKTELWGGFYFEDAVYIGMYFILFYLFDVAGWIHPSVTILYYIFNIIVAVLLLAPSGSPQRKNYQAILFRLIKMTEPVRFAGPCKKGGEMQLEE